jgi:radical SAM protein with 4Fe4S-binding SPASM domain
MKDEQVKAILDNLPEFTHAGMDYEAMAIELDATPETIQTVEHPRLYQVETTTRCNLACTFCPRTNSMAKTGKRDLNAVMPPDRLNTLLQQMPWVRSLELFHFGEPFMHNDLHTYVSLCWGHRVYVVLASNLLPATEEKIDRVFEAAGREMFLVMDIDSLDTVRYASMRVNGSLDVLRERVRVILSHPNRPYCVAQTIMVDGKPEYTMGELVAWTGGLRPDELRYKFLDSFRGTIAEKGGMGPHDLCREPFYGFTVHVNGDVVPCDRDWDGENVMGNVFETHPLEIWNGEKYRAFRAAMKSTEKPAMCRNCEEGKLVNLRSQPHVQVNMFRGEEIQHQ